MRVIYLASLVASRKRRGHGREGCSIVLRPLRIAEKIKLPR